jgi:hypothetical protein
VAPVSMSRLARLRRWLGALCVVGLGTSPALGQSAPKVDFGN